MPEQTAAVNEYIPKILVVDDEKRIRESCHTVLTGEGYAVACAENGSQGLQMIDREYFDIILLDLMMPHMSGLDILPEIKEDHPDTVVIVITGYSTVEHSIEAMKAGAFDFIPKPFSPKKLKVVVSKAIEHMRALKDIAEEKSRMRGLINRLSAGVVATDNRKQVVLANPALRKMMGYHGKHFIGKPVESITDNAKLLDMISQALTMDTDASPELTDEILLNNSTEQEEVVLNVRCAPIKDRIGSTLGTISVLHDITILKKMDQMKSDFVSLVSHEIRSPMNSVLMQLKVILDGLAGDITAKQQEMLTRASLKIHSLVDMASELLDLSKIESGLITLEKENIQFNDLLQDQVSFHYETAKAKQINLCFNPSPDLPPVQANLQNMEEVISNLVTNAINYTPEGGEIRLALTLENGYLCIVVADTGWGIPEEDLERVFTRFYRVKNEKTRYITGTGLGLPIIKSIVEAHN
ncbi:MAG: response regulator [Desulfobacterales bacterium]|nr:response regulator [Desulfobacterales bacterium]MDX2511956.1 response regulator [Desulfobacterales bacterium]